MFRPLKFAMRSLIAIPLIVAISACSGGLSAVPRTASMQSAPTKSSTHGLHSMAWSGCGSGELDSGCDLMPVEEGTGTISQQRACNAAGGVFITVLAADINDTECSSENPNNHVVLQNLDCLVTISSTLIGAGPKVGIIVTPWPGSSIIATTLNSVYGVTLNTDTCRILPSYANPTVG